MPFREIVRLYNLTNTVDLPARYNVAPTEKPYTCESERYQLAFAAAAI